MIKHIWSVLCSRSVIDIDTNNVSIQDIVEQVNINAEPVADGFLPIPLELVTLWERKDSDKPAKGIERITFVTPSGKSNIVSEAEIDLSNAERHRHRVKFPGVPLSEAGRYYFNVEIKNDNNEWNKVAAIPLKVIFQLAS
ncbi:MAG: hypothetical protein C4586_03585 [Anaerolineaceae bacterium]|nr:MAG: hypothetical protein C4586_03585 [Anaerolineaceae bacterium]